MVFNLILLSKEHDVFKIIVKDIIYLIIESNYLSAQTLKSYQSLIEMIMPQNREISIEKVN